MPFRTIQNCASGVVFQQPARPQSILIEYNRPIFLEAVMQSKKVLSYLILAVLLLGCTASVAGQASPSAQSSASSGVSDQDIEMLRADLRSQRKQITAQNMDLTADESTKFWPIFDQYRKEAIKANDDRWALIKENVANYNTMTDAQAQQYIQRGNDIDQQLLALRMKYVPTFEKVISPKKTALWYQIDRRIDLLINLQLSTQIPMVNTAK
jgi:Spy/CpxP family protein refolding chaperone